MGIVDKDKILPEEWRPGVSTRKLIGDFSGSQSIAMMEQTIKPGKGAPLHTHEVEELLFIQNGSLQITLGEEYMVAGSNHIVRIDALIPHSFSNSGSCDAIILVVFPHSRPFDDTVTKYLQ